MTRRQWRFLPLYTILCFLMSFVSAQEFVPYPDHHKRLVQGISFSPDMSKVYFTLPHREFRTAMGSATEIDPRLALYSAQIADGKWEEPALISFSGDYKDYEPTLSPDGALLFFNTDRSHLGSDLLEKNDIWYARIGGNGWETPVRLKFNTIEFEESYPTITSDGWLYYVAEKEIGNSVRYGIYETRFMGEETRDGRKLHLVDVPYECGDPFVSPAGDYLIYTRYDPENWQGTCDLYISFREGSQWTKGRPLSELNSDGPDFSPTVSPDGKWIFYRKNYRFQKAAFSAAGERPN